ncbi:GAF domain-containing SpoIIE family protein phosphatase [Williamsia sp. 1135]|uniref:PP2C family protein-serine/threonine phosphatase n=1 Tax=Williamsia sp. 1135 TaxID=1889262 RepID=UPI000A122131|nr:GAF domain-containing SpoIIE family protein phosphatase [Williamsia sp. 1135]ORM28680.1 serine/threonine protein phosphatase [Williamsia sp. 1135]
MSVDTEIAEIQLVLPPEVEEKRLRSLDQLQILDSPPEDRFERVTRMARLIFGVPMASVALLDRDRLWFKMVEGLPLSEVPRAETVCQTTVARTYTKPADPALIVDDLERVPEFARLPGVGGEGGVRFYAGYPLYGPGHQPVGTFCVYDTSPRTFDESQQATFRELAAWAQRELERADDLERAAAVQRQLLPAPLHGIRGYSVRSMCVPAYAVGGDFYDHYLTDEGAVFSVADVMGKGLGAAILTASVRSALRGASKALEHAKPGTSLGEAVSLVAGHVADDLSSTESFVTLFHARLERSTGHVDYIDAGHGLGLVSRKTGGVEPLPGCGLPLGVLVDEVWTAETVTLHPGDMLIVVSDGLLDLLSEDSDAHTVQDFVRGHSDPTTLCSAVAALASSSAPLDDVTVVAVRRDDVG